MERTLKPSNFKSEIKALRKAGWKYKDIAKIMDCSKVYVWHVLSH
jgi:DNA-directed RNA polymerase specialized sigma24 family protein